MRKVTTSIRVYGGKWCVVFDHEGPKVRIATVKDNEMPSGELWVPYKALREFIARTEAAARIARIQKDPLLEIFGVRGEP